MGGGGDKDTRPVVPDLTSKDLPYSRGSFVDAPFGSNSVAALFSLSPPPNRCEPLPPPPLPRCLPMGLDVAIPAIGVSGSVQGTTKRRIEFDEPIASSKSILLYAVPRSVVDAVHDTSRGICEPTQQPEADGGTCEAEEPTTAPSPPVVPFGPQQKPQTTFTPPFQLPAPAPAPIEPAPVSVMEPMPQLEVLELRGDFAITRHYSAYAVGAGSLTVVRSEHGVISLVDAGVGNIAHSELTESILAELATDIGQSPIAEVLLSHLHEDHTSLLPELARRYPIGKIRINAYQHQDPRMLAILRDVARASAERIREAVTAEAEPTRKAWEESPDRGQIDVNAETRAATWEEHVEGLVEKELAKSAIKLETAFVDTNGEVHVTESPILGDLILPKTPTAPVLLERGFLETSSPTGPRITTARPDIAEDLDALIKKQLEAGPDAPEEAKRAADYAVDANEATFVIDLGTAARLFVTPDKRAPNIASIKDVLEADVARLNAELAKLGKKPAKLHIWNMTHHAQVGFVTGASQIKSLVESLHTLTRVKHASGGTTMDVVLVSGHVAKDGTTQTLVDPLTVWTLNELGIDVIVATDKTVELLEVMLHDGTSVAGLTEAPYKTGIASEGTLRKVEAALRKINADIDLKETQKPKLKGSTRPIYDEQTKTYEADMAALKKFRTDLKAARDAYIDYHEAKLRPVEEGKPAPGIPPGDTEAAAKKAAIDTLLADERVKGVAEDAAAKTPVFDAVALTLMKRPPSGIPPELRELIDAILRTDALRQQLADADTIDTRAELAKELTALKPLLKAHADKAPPGTKEVINSVLEGVESELGQVTKPTGNGEVSNATTPDGAFTVEQRLQFEKAKPLSTSGDGVRWFADKTTRPLGALMIYSIVKKQHDLKQGLADDKVTIPEFALGTIHSAYGFTIGVRMLKKVEVNNAEFAILAVLDILETTTRHYATDEERWTAIEYSVIRNVLQVGLSYLGTWMMTRKNRYVAAAGFLIQFAVDPFLEYIGLYSWLEKKNDFLPDDVVTVRQRIRGLMSEYTTLIGLLELSRRENLSSLSEDSEVKNRIQSEITSYRSKVTKTEASLLTAFEEGYYTAKTAFAGLLDLDRMRAQFLELQFLAHQGDTENDAKSRRQILDAFEKIEADINLDWLSDDAIRAMPQWGSIDGKLNELEGRVRKDVDWDAVTDTQDKLDQMLANARYRLDPGALRVRTAPLLTSGTQAHATYEALLDERETRAAKIYERLFGATPVEPTADPVEDAITRADRAVAAYATALAAVPAFEGLTLRQLQENSFDLAKTYPAYVGSHTDYGHALDKLQAAESMLRSTVMRLDALAMPIMTAPMSSSITTRVEAIHDAMASHMADRLASGFLFADEAKQRALDIRPIENAAIAKKLGETGVQALSSPERMAIINRDLPVSSSSTFIDRLNAMPMVARVAGDGYMEGVYRYVGWDAKESDNVLVGDLRRTVEVADAWSDQDRDAHLFVPLNQAAINIWANHFIIFSDPILGRSPYSDVPRPCLEFDDDEKAALKRIKFEELKP